MKDPLDSLVSIILRFYAIIAFGLLIGSVFAIREVIPLAYTPYMTAAWLNPTTAKFATLSRIAEVTLLLTLFLFFVWLSRYLRRLR